MRCWCSASSRVEYQKISFTEKWLVTSDSTPSYTSGLTVVPVLESALHFRRNNDAQRKALELLDEEFRLKP